ncbi:hypothetical protein AB0P40_02115 [Streptomyces sp. NPDC079189]|uniref:hypothetical protein n=1 Tax=Streptomyces sp. NPDC079189 TaxID=3154514 RepID=UPI00342597D1
MDLTTLLAIFGAVTGGAGLVWQLWSHRLTGGRVQLLAIREWNGESWTLQVDVLNVGRLDVSLVGFTIWLDVRGHRWRKLRRIVRLRRQVGFVHSRRSLFVLEPSVTLFGGPYVAFGDDDMSVELPCILKAGSMLRLPSAKVRLPQAGSREVHVAVHLGANRVVKARAVTADSFRLTPFELPADHYEGASIEVANVRTRREEPDAGPRRGRFRRQRS